MAQRLQRQEGALRRVRLQSRSTTLAKRRVKESQRRLRKQEARSNRACGIRIGMKLAEGAVEAQPSAIAEISGDPSTGQTVTLKPGVRVPPRNGYLVVDATSSGPGVLGKVSATSKLRGGRTKLSLRPATLDQAYERFDLRFDGSLAALSDSSALRTQEGATASAQSSASKLTLFRCQGPRIKRPDIVVDLTPLKVSSEIDVQRRYVHFLVSGRPLLRLRFEITAGAKCQLDENVKVFIPVAGPVGIELAPVVELSAGADSKLDFELAPRIAVGFERGGPSGDQDFRVFNTAGGPSVTLHGSLGVDAFAGGAIGVSVGGRAGLRGKFGPAFIARGSAGAGRICAEVDSALRIGLDAYANVFIANLAIQLGKGEFLRRSLYSGCVGDGQGGGSSGTGVGSPALDYVGPIELFSIGPWQFSWKITGGPDGNIWGIDTPRGSIGRVTPAGSAAQFLLPGTKRNPVDIAAGPDGNVWFAVPNDGTIGKITPQGTISEFDLAIRYGTTGSPDSVTAGPDGNIWYSIPSGGVAKMAPSGSHIEDYYPPPTGHGCSPAHDLTVGPDGNLWFGNCGRIGRVTLDGEFTYLPLAVDEYAHSFISGPDGNLWASSYVWHQGLAPSYSLMKIAPGGSISRIPLPGRCLGSIASGSDGNIWFADRCANDLVRRTPAGDMTGFSMPPGEGEIGDVTAGPDGNIWFSLYGNLGRVKL